LNPFTIYYFGLKIALFLSLIRSYVKFEPLQKHALFLAIFYTLGLAFLSYAFLVAPQQPPVVWRAWEHHLVKRLLPPKNWALAIMGWRAWQIWLVESFVLFRVYLKLLSRFEDGALFWFLLMLAPLLIAF
jgi:hypothetical protein